MTHQHLSSLPSSCHDLLNLRLMHMWSIWFSVTWFGDIHVALWMRLCGKMLPPITSWFRAHRSAKRSPFSFICPSPCVPMMSSYPVLSIPILALKSPISMVMSFVPDLFCLTLLVAVGRSHPSSLPPHHWWEHSTGWCSAWCLSSWW